MRQTADVVVVGGGIIGVSVAYHLAKLGVERIVVLEREEALGTGSTGKCAGGVRLQFSTLANIEMSRRSIADLEGFEDELGVPIDFRRNGYLFVLTSEDDLEVFRGNAARQREMDVPVEVLTPEEARGIVPELAIDDLVGATFCGADGIANPHAIVQGYARGARQHGVTIRTEAEVTDVETVGERAARVALGDETIEAGWVVNAAGPWAKNVAGFAGVALPVEPVRRQYFLTQPMPWVSPEFPLLIDWSTGCYMHHESGGLLIGESDLEEPPSFSQKVDWDFLARVSEHAVACVPRVEEAEIQSGVAGLYEVSPDHNAIIGVSSELENFVCANGFSGHGMQHAPAVGLGVAELIVNGEATSVDLAAFAPDRFASGAAGEFNVI